VYFFDGFNFYHSLKEKHREYLWLDYWRLAEIFTPKTNKLSNVLLFTTYAKWRPESYMRHKKYLSVLRSRGVEIILGKFYKKMRGCQICGNLYEAHEEKQTDINIAVSMLTWAIQDRFDELVIGSADSDLIPAIKALRSAHPDKKITLLFPLGRKSFDLKNLGLKVMHVKKKHLASSQLPREVRMNDGSVVKRPVNWS